MGRQLQRKPKMYLKSSSGEIFRVGRIRELLGTEGWMRGGRGAVVGRTYPHMDMVTPIGRAIIFGFIFCILVLRVSTRGRTAQDGDCD